jgi:hypothetical protein
MEAEEAGMVGVDMEVQVMSTEEEEIVMALSLKLIFTKLLKLNKKIVDMVMEEVMEVVMEKVMEVVMEEVMEVVMEEVMEEVMEVIMEVVMEEVMEVIMEVVDMEEDMHRIIHHRRMIMEKHIMLLHIIALE